MKKALPALIAFVSMFGLGIFSIWATEVLGPKAMNPRQVVLARHLAMEVLGANLSEINQKIKSGLLEGIAMNALNMSALAVFIPLAFEQPYQEAYPKGHMEHFFKGAPPEDFRALTQNLNDQARILIKLAEKKDLAGVEAQVPKLVTTCKNCHAQYRGEKK